MILALLLACAVEPGGPAGGEPGPRPVRDSGVEDSGEAYAPPAFANPAEAEDLDDEPAVVRVRLTAAPAVHAFQLPPEDGGALVEREGYAYNGLLPGPTIRARLGDTLIVELENALDLPTTLHWHGMHVPFEMDGGTWMLDPVEPGESTTYSFSLDHAGTFWYHPHFNSDATVDAGLYGFVVVEDPDEPATDQELLMLFDDWALPGYGEADGEDDHGMDGEVGRWTLNGLVDPVITLTGGETARVRLLNVSNVGYLSLSWPEMRVIAGDQGLSAAISDEPVLLGPGDRAEAEWRPGAEGFVVEDLGYTANGGAMDMAEDRVVVEVESPADAAPALDWGMTGDAPTEDPGRTDLLYTLSGDVVTGEWFINGEQWPDVTIAEVALDSTVVVEVRNLSPTEHPFHMHGYGLELLSVDGVAPAHRTFEDTINVPIYSAVRLLLRADNPGEWMTHCHILPHAEGGMMTVIDVLDMDASPRAVR